ARTDRLLALSTGTFLPAAWQAPLGAARAAASVAITALLAVASADLALIDFRYGGSAAWGIPVWCFTAVMPVGFALMTFRLIERASTRWGYRLIAAAGLAVAAAAAFVPPPEGAVLWLLGALIAVATLLGLPIYAALGGVA